MPSQKYAVNQYLIETILAWVKSGEIAIPEIQRPFVWDAAQVRDLIDSLYQGYPIGYIIAWKNPNVRLKDGSLSEGKKILIDGQQRVTALGAALTGLQVINKDYRKVRIRIAFNPMHEKFEVLNTAIERSGEWIHDIAPIMQGEISMMKLMRQYLEKNPDIGEDRLEQIITQLTGITKKQIGLIELAAELDIETVTEIFIRINAKGVVLSQADFAMSKIAANESYGGNTLRKAIDYFCHLAVAPEFHSHIEEHDSAFAATDYFKAMRWLHHENDDLYDPSYTDMLRVAFTSQFNRGRLADLVALLSGRDFETRSYDETIAEQSFETLKRGVNQFMNETHFKRFLMIIKSAGFIDRSLINAQNPLNFAYILFLRLRQDGYPAADIERYVRRWFVLSTLTQRYSGQPESRFDLDIREIAGRHFGEHLDRMERAELSDAFWDVGLPQLLATSNRNHPAFGVFLAAQAKAGDRGFLSSDIKVSALIEHKGDLHHLFPRDYLKKRNLSRSQYNQVANYVYSQSEINIALGNKPPVEYMQTVLAQCEGGPGTYGGITDHDDLMHNLAENAVPESLLHARFEDYSALLEERRLLMAQKIQRYYQAL
jgi:hypothetical protein